ncbi:sodium-dependent transporter [Microbulbifer spongiae]|uniref:Sodium-dependent transporter n=1 Tax=Microbulbifer spongiae TaxID=2944933 RepID=A0ABY9E898_9GAMM|nr:sodium-dependent transporter [Microbulbifer sp. MI-G]WKD49223.1 sodium-dependent transporter [Microbulbifer sp. MI-G]
MDQVAQKPARTEEVARRGHEQWSSDMVFVLAALGSAVGLGNIWRFPYVAGENGGSAFIAVYLLFVLSIGLPALIATIMVGRRGQASPDHCFERIAATEGLSRRWRQLGWLLVLTTFLLLTFFSVVAGWIFDYLFKALSGRFAGLEADTSAALFDALKADPLRQALWHGAFMSCTLVVVAFGIRRGIEVAVKWMMPGLALLLVVLVVHSMSVGDGAAAARFLFQPDFSELDADVLLLAVGQALISLSVGGAGMVVYGSYLRREASIPRTASVIASADTLVALLTGLVIFPIVFAFGLEPSGGPGMIFVTLPVAFGQIPGGALFGTLFFVLLLLAALTSAFSMFEPAVSWLEQHRGLSRKRAALSAGAVAWFVGLSTVFSFNIWSHVRPLAWIPPWRDMSIFQGLEQLVANLASPLGALLISIFVAWKVSERLRREEFGSANGVLYPTWRLLARYFVPVAIAAIFIASLF